jgi:hypothetical protein
MRARCSVVTVRLASLVKGGGEAVVVGVDGASVIVVVIAVDPTSSIDIR